MKHFKKFLCILLSFIIFTSCFSLPVNAAWAPPNDNYKDVFTGAKFPSSLFRSNYVIFYCVNTDKFYIYTSDSDISLIYNSSTGYYSFSANNYYYYTSSNCVTFTSNPANLTYRPSYSYIYFANDDIKDQDGHAILSEGGLFLLYFDYYNGTHYSGGGENDGDYLSGVFNWLNSILNGIFNLPSTLYNFFSSLFSSIWVWLSSIFNSITSGFSNTFSNFGGWFSNLWTWLSDIFNKITSGFSDTLSNLGGWFSNLWTWLSDIFSKITSGFSDTLTNLGSWFSNLWTWFGNLFTNLGNWFSELYTNIIDGIKRIFIPDTEKIDESIDNLSSVVKSKFGIDSVDLSGIMGVGTQVKNQSGTVKILGYEFTGDFLDVSYLVEGVATFRPYIRGFIILLIFLFNINQFLHFINAGGLSLGANIATRLSGGNKDDS